MESLRWFKFDTKIWNSGRISAESYEVQGVFLQYVHRAAIVSLVFQFGDALVEGVQFLFKLLDRPLDRKFSSGKFPRSRRLRALVEPITSSISLCSHHFTVVSVFMPAF